MTTKPHLYRLTFRTRQVVEWCCCSSDRMAWGDTPTQAYTKWADMWPVPQPKDLI